MLLRNFNLLNSFSFTGRDLIELVDVVVVDDVCDGVVEVTTDSCCCELFVKLTSMVSSIEVVWVRDMPGLLSKLLLFTINSSSIDSSLTFGI